MATNATKTRQAFRAMADEYDFELEDLYVWKRNEHLRLAIETSDEFSSDKVPGPLAGYIRRNIDVSDKPPGTKHCLADLLADDPATDPEVTEE